MTVSCSRFITRNADETRGAGKIVGQDLVPGDLVALTGDLGSGKTCLTQGLARGLDVPERSYVRSPTFIILNMYEGRCPLYHIDLYRIYDPVELEDLGYREIFYGEGVTAIEWADRIPDLLPEEHLHIHLDFLDETSREIFLEPKGKRFEDRCRVWKKQWVREPK